jgi:hypothetical protein
MGKIEGSNFEPEFNQSVKIELSITASLPMPVPFTAKNGWLEQGLLSKNIGNSCVKYASALG